MTLVSDIINRAYRSTNIIPLGTTPTADQTTEALDHFNTLLLSTFGNEVSDGLTDLTVGGNYDQSEFLDQWIPNGIRLLLNLTSAKTYNLDPCPEDGQRFSVVDVAGNLATYNVTINGNGRTIEGSTTKTLNTNSVNRQWMYRADLGDWVVIASLTGADNIPFPEEFDNYFILMLALQLNPQYGQHISVEQSKLLGRSRSQLNARYAQNKEVRSDIDWRSVPSQSSLYSSFSDLDDFTTGRRLQWK